MYETFTLIENCELCQPNVFAVIYLPELLSPYTSTCRLSYLELENACGDIAGVIYPNDVFGCGRLHNTIYPRISAGHL